MNETTSTSSDVILLLILMLAAWGLLAFDLYRIVSVTPGGGEGRYSRGSEMLWAFGLSLAAWVFMGLTLYRQHAPGGLLVGLLSAAAAFCALLLMDEGKSSWPAVIPLVLPLVIAGASFTRYWLAERVALIVLSLIPCATFAGSTIMTSIAKSRQREEVNEATRQKNLAIVGTIAENQPLRTWLELLRDDSGVRPEALAVMRQLQRRQADVEQAISEGLTVFVDHVPDLDLQLTPRLLQLLNAWCMKEADYGRTFPPGGDEILERTFFFSPLPVMRWVRSKGGDCSESVAALKSAALLYRDTPVRRKLVRGLEDISRGPGGSR